MKILFIISALFLVTQVYGQQEAIDYQTILTTKEGDPLKFVDVELRIDIIQGSSNGTVVFSEIHAATTGLNGEISLAIGKGNPDFMTMDNIDWTKPNFIELFIKPDGIGVFITNNVTEMLSVPYALFALKLTCDDGCPGERGVDGANGPSGPTGPQGDTGATAATGQWGPSGADGAPGLSGIESLNSTDIVPSNPVLHQVYIDDGSNRSDGQPGFRYFDGADWVNL